MQRATLDNLFEAVAVIGADGRLKLFNPAYSRVWSLAEEFLATEPHFVDIVERGRPFHDPQGDWPAYKAQAVSALASREPRQMRIERADGSVLDHATLPLPDGAVLLIYLDVTDRFLVENALRERNEALLAADRLKSEIVAHVSYELRTPLTAIRGFAEVLETGLHGSLTEQQRGYSRGILDSAGSLLSLVNNLLDLASIEAGTATADLEPVDIHALLVGVLGATREWAERRNLDIRLDCAPTIGRMLADERRLKQALTNLVGNAVRFTEAGGTITLSGHRDASEIVLSVADTGSGIPAEDQQRVFGKFECRNNLKPGQSGAGLGLALVKSLIELHGGRVTLESEPGRGTSVVCTIPTAPRRR